ncbi:hypothetical protein [Halioxenophilus sp. WMMB6]|uniref:hypothetical protein n=1 Tax=Halioxenophilus sp. WMMB6 TaxID=3073815 RepID=UPI00295E9480|nr:hypothetical protein [Halioxenophilus sp. WMMB6]
MEKKKKFVIEQLDEALEERQQPDRRVSNQGFENHAPEERRKYDRRGASKNPEK